MYVVITEKGETEGDSYTPMLNDMITVTPEFLGKEPILLYSRWVASINFSQIFSRCLGESSSLENAKFTVVRGSWELFLSRQM